MSPRPSHPDAAKAHDARLRAEAAQITRALYARRPGGRTATGFPDRSAKAVAARLSWERRHVLGAFA